MEAINLTALLTSIITLLIVFVKTIRKCKCYRGGIEIERRDENGVESQHHFILELLQSIKTNFTPRRKSEDVNDQNYEEQNHEKQIDNNQINDEEQPCSSDNLTNYSNENNCIKITQETTTKEIAEHLDMVPKNNMVNVQIKDLLDKSYSRRDLSNQTPFIVNKK